MKKEYGFPIMRKRENRARFIQILAKVLMCLFFAAMCVLYAVSLAGCEKQSVEDAERTLSTVKSELRSVNADLRRAREELGDARATLSDDVFWLEIEIKQSTFTLDIAEHIKNRVNAMKISIPVDREFYSSASVGQLLSSGLKVGSLAIDGDISNLNITVTKKFTTRREK